MQKACKQALPALKIHSEAIGYVLFLQENALSVEKSCAPAWECTHAHTFMHSYTNTLKCHGGGFLPSNESDKSPPKAAVFKSADSKCYFFFLKAIEWHLVFPTTE